MAKRRRSNKKEPKGVIYLIVLACLAAVFHEPIANALRNKLPVPTEKTAKRAETTETTGNPLLPAPLKNVPEQILHRKGYTASYNREHKIPNWVAWELTPEKLIERESRTDKFLPDPDLPESQAVTTDDYKRSGMDRGHMCPAGDNRWHWKAMQESFYMTNICPQNHNLNRGDWKELEEACRLWAKKEGKISAIVPMVSHVDHSEHDVNIIVTEQGVADLRGKSPKERAQAIIENCVHPDYKNILWDYLKLTDGKAQTPHAVRAALAMHAELAKSGDMKNVDWGEYK